MNILILHNAYQQAGGEDAVVRAEAALLAQAGHAVTVEEVSNHTISTPVDKLRTFLDTPYAVSRKAWTRALIARTQADIVHVHNFFPLLTPAVHEAAAEAGVAVVQTLHNYRLLCANAQLLRDGHICEKCVAGTYAWGAIHRCYRGSLPASLAVVRMQQRSARHATWQNHVHRFIALTEFARRKFIEGGLPADRIAIKANFTSDIAAEPTLPRHGALFVGRLSPEKGVETLLRAWQSLPDIPLTIIGDGPSRPQLQARAPANVRFLGPLPPNEVRRHMAAARCLIMPSIWYEGAPLTLVEAFASALPVIGSRLGALAEMIAPGVNGLHFAAGDADDLARTVRAAFADPARLVEMGRAARQTYLARYTPAQNLLMLEDIYDQALRLAHSSAERRPALSPAGDLELSARHKRRSPQQ